jgi:hypothetical protein
MTLTLELRSEAEAEAARLRRVRTIPRPNLAAAAADEIGVTMIRRSAEGPLAHAGAIFMVRARIVDRPGRLLEDFFVPVQLKLPVACVRRTRRSARDIAQQILALHAPAVIAAARQHISIRLAEMLVRYGGGVQRSIRREESLARLFATEAPPLVQAGLFDGRALKARASDRARELLASNESDARRRSLRSAMAEITAQEPDLVLVLLVSSRRT